VTAPAVETHTWWASLRHGGFLLDEQRLRAHFPSDPERALSAWALEQLRSALTDFQATPEETEARTRLLNTLLEIACRLDGTSGGTWQRGRALDGSWTVRSVTGEAIRPAQVWDGANGRRLLVFTTPEKRLGVGHGRRAVARVLEWLRARNESLAILSNGHQVRLLYAGADSFAWCESDSALWLIEGRAGPQLDALRLLLTPAALTPVEDNSGRKISPLLRGIQDSRKGQAELSAILGERVRMAVERLIQSHGPFLNGLENPPLSSETYVAACRVVMRLVFAFFAEARDLLPRSHAIYHQSYSLAGLLAELDRSAGGSGGQRLAHRFGAWPRILALCRLIYSGSAHEALPLLAYGGTLFEPGKSNSLDGISRAIWVFEHACFDAAHQTMPDREVWEILQLLTRTKVAIRQGRGRALISVQVDFSDLSSEYIGILYEGLLDYELRCVSDDDAAVLFLAVGNEPALPLARLEAMDDAALKGLFEAFKKAASEAVAGDEEGGEEESEDAAAEDEMECEEADAEAGLDEFTMTEDVPAREAALQRAHTWARKAADKAGLVRKPRARGGAATLEYERNLENAAKQLVRRLVLPGEWYLVRWGGTRKGAGTFYTRPGLALPTIRRTLEPLVYTCDDAGRLIPKTPEVILEIKACDPATGSGTFPVGALRYITEALFRSVFHHGWLEFAEERQIDGSTREVIRPVGNAAASHPLLARLLDEVRLRAMDDELRLRAYLKRLVVENCIYGVDLDPLAIELARLALWIETMDPSLPFSFLDHKFRCGNGLVGTWLDRFQHYPVMAWLREGGDKTHTTGVHFQKEVWTRAFKQRLGEVIKPALRSFIEETSDQTFAFVAEGYAPTRVQEEARAQFAAIHADLRDPDEQCRLFETWRQSYGYMALRDGLDLWCALWFWPPDHLELAPTPTDFHAPSTDAKAIVRCLRAALRFFHWELEFPDVFNADRGGFDALLGNPPWEIQKPNSQEWFSNVDPLYRSYSKQEALRRQRAMFESDINIEAAWISYNARLKALSNWTRSAGFPFGDPTENDDLKFPIAPGRAGADLHRRWRERRGEDRGFADHAHPFRHQGSADINTYKLFLEQSFRLLREGGRLGMITPSGIISDKGTSALRRLFLSHARWEFAFGFINWNKIFTAVYYRFKFCIIGLERCGSTESIQTAFSRYNLEDWEEAEKYFLPYTVTSLREFSPASLALVEVRDARDMAILQKEYSRGILLGDQSPDSWNLRYATEFHMTNDAEHFPPLPDWETNGFVPDEYGHWLRGGWQPYSGPTYPPDRSTDLVIARDGASAIRIQDIQEMAVPLYEGRMIGQFDFSQKGWVSGKGRTALWRDISWEKKRIEPQYLMGIANLLNRSDSLGPKAPFMPIGSATNARTGVSTYLRDFPAGHSVTYYKPRSDKNAIELVLLFSAALNSYAYDYGLRSRLGGLNLSEFLMAETVLYRPGILGGAKAPLLGHAARLMLGHPVFSRDLLSVMAMLKRAGFAPNRVALSPAYRLQSSLILECVHAHLFGLRADDFAWLLRSCDHPKTTVNSKHFMRTLDPKGFWRVDKERDPELRHTVLAQVAFTDLQAHGLDAFLAANDGEGWMLPETLRLADYGLGHDARARQPQPVAARLGPRLLPWQLDRNPAESWAECEAHATLLDTLWRHARALGASRAGEENSLDTAVAGTSPAVPAAPRPGVSNRDGAQQTELAL
jgi:hypothetical protein